MATQGFDTRDIQGRLLNAIETRFEGSWSNSVALYNPNSDRAAEQYGLFGGNPKLAEWIGPRDLNEIASWIYEIRNKKFQSGIKVPVEYLDRDKSGLLQSRLNSFANDTVNYFWEDMITGLINTNGTCYDGTAFFGTGHIYRAGGAAQKNIVTATEIPVLNVVDPANPTAAEMADIILNMVAYQMTIMDDQGRQMNGNAKSFTIAVSTMQLYAVLLKALSNTNLTGFNDNPLSGLKAMGYTFTPKFIQALTGATQKVRLFRTDGDFKPFILQEEEEVTPQFLGEDSDYYVANDAYFVGVKCRRGGGYALWQQALEGQMS